MKFLLAALLPLIFTLSAPAAGPLRVLFLGHENNSVHHASAHCALLMEKLGRDGIYFDYFTDPACLTPDTLRPFDAVMIYANHDRISPEQFATLNTFVEAGRGFLPIHCASACFNHEPRFISMVGARFARHGGEVFKPSFLEKTHPILRGVQEYSTWDETYVHDQHNEQGRLLLAHRQREPWTWVREQGKGRVFYTASGHDLRTWNDVNFQLMLKNAILWTVGEARAAEWRSFCTHREVEKREPKPTVANYEKRAEPVSFQHPFSAKGSMERTQVPTDMRLELFAAEPNIMKPIALAWDERGRCWVAETADYPHRVSGSGVGSDRITICEDVNGDGRADKFTTFADKLNIPTSLVLVNGGVIVAQPPRFLFLKDTNGDDKADLRQEVLTGWGIGDTHAQANSLHYGYDNWLHGCVGYSGFRGSVGGQQLSFSQGTYRFRADGSALEFLHQFSNNSWGHSQNAAGDDFGGTANNAPLFFGGIPRTAAPAGMNLMTAQKINVEDKAHAITPHYRQVDVFGGYTAAAGSAFIYSENMPARLQGQALVAEPTMKLISLMDVEPKGAGYVAKDGFNLVASSDEWMSPVFAEVGPDGAVWFADWQNFIIQHNPTPSSRSAGYDAKTGAGGAHENPLRDHARGRIYRVVWNQAKPATLTTLKTATTAELVQALNHPTQFWRITAQRLLVEGRKTDAVPALQSVVRSLGSQVGAIHALWALHGLGVLDAETHSAALRSSSPALRRNAVRALGTDAASVTLLSHSGSAADPDPGTQLAALVKLAECSMSPAASLIVSQLRDRVKPSSDEWLREALKLVMRKHAAGSGLPAGPNTVPNPGFEDLANGQPQYWRQRHYNGEADWDMAATGKSGKSSLHVKSSSGTDTSYCTDLAVEPDTDYQLSAWVRTRGVHGALGALLNVHGTPFQTNAVTADSDWTKVEVVFNSEGRRNISVNALFGGYGQSTGEAWFDDVTLRTAGLEADSEASLAGDVKRGETLFFKHPATACVLCHQLKGLGSAVGPPLDGIASRVTPEYLNESLMEPSKVLAKGFEKLGVSPMPPVGLILKPQELADIKAFVLTLK